MLFWGSASVHRSGVTQLKLSISTLSDFIYCSLRALPRYPNWYNVVLVGQCRSWRAQWCLVPLYSQFLIVRSTTILECRVSLLGSLPLCSCAAQWCRQSRLWAFYFSALRPVVPTFSHQSLFWIDNIPYVVFDIVAGILWRSSLPCCSSPLGLISPNANLLGHACLSHSIAVL